MGQGAFGASGDKIGTGMMRNAVSTRDAALEESKAPNLLRCASAARRGSRCSIRIPAAWRRLRAAAVFILLPMVACSDSTEAPSPGDLERAQTGQRWSLIVLPDTQCYVYRAPEILAAQIDWILEQRAARDIRFVAHVGDVVQHNSTEEWQRAKEIIGRLAGEVPYSLLPGNHDFGSGGTADRRSSQMDDFFSRDDLDTRESFGGSFEAGSIWNTFHYVPGTDWMIVSLEFGPRQRVLDWAGDTLSSHSDRRSIVVTHSFLYHDGSRYDREAKAEQRWNVGQYGIGADASDGQQIWDALVSPHANVRLVLSGHVLGDGVARLVSRGESGQPVHQLLANYQVTARECPQREDGGGYLRIMTFDERPGAPTRLEVSTYSPWRDAWLRDPEQQFSIELSPP